jgi:hypothetical protein
MKEAIEQFRAQLGAEFIPWNLLKGPIRQITGAIRDPVILPQASVASGSGRLLAGLPVKPGNKRGPGRRERDLDQLIRFESRFRHSDLSFRSTARPIGAIAAAMVAVLFIAVCYAAGLAVHYHWYAHLVPPSLSFDEPVDRGRSR